MTMSAKAIRSVAIVGGGAAGWIAASILARTLGPSGLSITLVESPEIGTIGVGEATIPPILDLLRLLGIDAADFVRHTNATYKLGIKFIDWREVGEAYWHPFGDFGAPIALRPFHNAFLKARSLGLYPQVRDFSACVALAESDAVFGPGTRGAEVQKYALHFDASLAGRYLSTYAQSLGVHRMERTVRSVDLDQRGFIDSLLLSDGETLKADLFIDCSGFKGLLIEGALKTGYEDWSAHLPCDRAIAGPVERDQQLAPYTVSKAQSAGWMWRIPLQHRTGVGHVYSSAYMDDQVALDLWMQQRIGAVLAEPRRLQFVTGRRKQFWSKNCVALGLASGFVEPLESTSIQLVINGVLNLLDHFPDTDFAPHLQARYNRDLIREFEGVRDFIILHYVATARRDSRFWQDRRTQALPDSLLERLNFFRATGRVLSAPRELFTDLSWFFVLEGMGVVPTRVDPMLEVASEAQLTDILKRLAAETAAKTSGAPLHRDLFPGPSQTTPDNPSCPPIKATTTSALNRASSDRSRCASLSDQARST